MQLSYTPLIKQLEGLHLLESKGNALDLGAGVGKEGVALAQRGYSVTLVDKGNNVGQHYKASDSGELSITTIQADIRDFAIQKNFYSLIICKNVLPFLSSKDEIYTVIRSMIDGLTTNGILHFTLFGPNDAWATEKKDTMTFIDYGDALAFLGTLPIAMIHRLTEEGMAPRANGELKYWHIHRFIYKKL